jgi:hypothetical protein
MKNECSVVRDLLPLYLEDMVREETGAFVQEHLESCPTCAAEFAAMQAEPNVEQFESDLDAAVAKSIQAVRKKIRKKVSRVAAGVAAIILAVCVLLHFFPVYRIVEIGPMTLGSYYSTDQIALALSIGAAFDRSEAQAVLRLADQAFSDTRHTRAENEAAYGLLARYATATDSYDDAAFNTHSLELWSAHLDEDEGWLWVYYSSETFDHNGDTIRGSWRVPALWKVEKNNAGDWVVVQILEHA